MFQGTRRRFCQKRIWLKSTNDSAFSFQQIQITCRWYISAHHHLQLYLQISSQMKYLTHPWCSPPFSPRSILSPSSPPPPPLLTTTVSTPPLLQKVVVVANTVGGDGAESRSWLRCSTPTKEGREEGGKWPCSPASKAKPSPGYKRGGTTSPV